MIQKNKIHFVNESLLEMNLDVYFKNIAEEETFIICMEVLDNFSHDRVLIKRNNNIINFHKLSYVNINSTKENTTMVDLDINDQICPIAKQSMDLYFEF